MDILVASYDVLYTCNFDYEDETLKSDLIEIDEIGKLFIIL